MKVEKSRKIEKCSRVDSGSKVKNTEAVFNEDLQNMLSDEFMLAMQHKNNYEILKNAFNRLYDAYTELESSYMLSNRGKNSKYSKNLEVNAKMHFEQQQPNEQQSRQISESNEQLIQQKHKSIKQEIINELEQSYNKTLLNFQDTIENLKNENQILQENLLKSNKLLTKEREEFKMNLSHTQLLYEAEISNLKMLKNAQHNQINQLTDENLEKYKKLIHENAHLQAKCTELINDLEQLKKFNQTQKEKLTSDCYEQSKICNDLKAKNLELEAQCNTQKNQLSLFNQEVESLRHELVSQRQTALESVRARFDVESQLNKLLEATRTELNNLIFEAQNQRIEIEKQREESNEKSKAIEYEFERLSARCLETVNTNELTDSIEQNIQHNNQLHNEFIMKMENFENKISNISERLDSEIFEMHNFQLQTSDFMKKSMETSVTSQINLRKMENQYLQADLSEYQNKFNTLRSEFKQYVENANKKKKALCLRIMVLKNEVKTLQTEVETLRGENLNLRKNIPLSEYERIKEVYQDLRRKHQEYERIILGSNVQLINQKDQENLQL